MVIEDGKKFLDFIGATEKLDGITAETAQNTPRAKARRTSALGKKYAKVSSSRSSHLKKAKKTHQNSVKVLS